MGRTRLCSWQRRDRDARRQKIRAEEAEFLSDLRIRYPGARTEHSVLVSHVIRSDSIGGALHAACVADALYYSSMKKALIKRAEVLASALTDNEECFASSERNLFGAIMKLIASVNSQRSHETLLRFFNQISISWLRADILEAMAWEKSVFDVEFVLSKTEIHNDASEIDSALYALMFFGFGFDEPEITRERIGPLLQHPYWGVRVHAIKLLAPNPENREFLESCLNDQSPCVRQVAQEELRCWYSEETPEPTTCDPM